VKCEIKRPARVPGRAEGPAARGAPLALPRRKPHRGRRSCADVRDVSWGAAGAGRALPGLQLESVGGRPGAGMGEVRVHPFPPPPSPFSGQRRGRWRGVWGMGRVF